MAEPYPIGSRWKGFDRPSGAGTILGWSGTQGFASLHLGLLSLLPPGEYGPMPDIRVSLRSLRCPS